MNIDERKLYLLVLDSIPIAGSATEDDLAALRHMVDFGRHLFPSLFIDVLYDPVDTTQRYAVSRKVSQLKAILQADSKIPDALKAKKVQTNSGFEELDPTFSLDANETARVLELCAVIRSTVSNSNTFDVPHKRRLLNRVAAIEREVHLPKGRLDVILGGVSEVGEALGKFGKDVKPLVDRMKEIAGIARNKSEEYAQLPPPEEVKRLPAPEDSKDNS